MIKIQQEKEFSKNRFRVLNLVCILKPNKVKKYISFYLFPKKETRQVTFGQLETTICYSSIFVVLDFFNVWYHAI